MKTKLDLLLSDLKDFNIYFEDDGQVELLEELDDIEELYYEIQIELYNDDTLTEGWKESIRDNFILKKDGTRVYMKEFAELVYSTEDEWRMEGDEKYIDLDEL
jgi:uncharacterized protein YciU (UPF0263 family)